MIEEERERLLERVLDEEYPIYGPITKSTIRRVVRQGLKLGLEEGKYAERKRVCDYLLDHYLSKDEVATMLSFLDDGEGA